MNKLPSIHLNQVEFKTLMQEASNKYNIGGYIAGLEASRL